jgi:hypothetical protein
MGSLSRRVANRLPHLRAAIRPSSYRAGAVWLPLADSEPRREVDPARLGALFATNGSDKTSEVHDFEVPYAMAISHAVDGPILEIGIGTNHLDVPSTMGVDGVPGASLRAWAQLGAFTAVHGADVDRRILFTEPGITTHFVDQLDEHSLGDLRATLAAAEPSGFAMIVDDGLHTVPAVRATARALWPLLAPGGIYAIEDLEAEGLREVLPDVLALPGRADWALWSNPPLHPANQVVMVRRSLS